MSLHAKGVTFIDLLHVHWNNFRRVIGSECQKAQRKTLMTCRCDGRPYNGYRRGTAKTGGITQRPVGSNAVKDSIAEAWQASCSRLLRIDASFKHELSNRGCGCPHYTPQVMSHCTASENQARSFFPCIASCLSVRFDGRGCCNNMKGTRVVGSGEEGIGCTAVVDGLGLRLPWGVASITAGEVSLRRHRSNPVGV